MSVLQTSAEHSLDPSSIFAAIDFEGLRSVIVAVSGGSDSLALLHLLLAFRDNCDAFPEIIAVTVDHELRAESNDEAHYVGQLCRAANISHRILRWSGPKPLSGISAKAREMRYSLLIDAARDAGAGVILTGHTLDDQIETFVMRSARATAKGSGRGQAGMARATLLKRQIWLVRPLLETSRESLREYLRKIGVSWRDDPSNDNTKYERVRVRQALRNDDRERLKRAIDAKIDKRQAVNEKIAAALPSIATISRGICAEITRESWAGLDTDAQRLAIGVLLATMGGQLFLPSTALCDKALAFLNVPDVSRRVAMSRCIIETRAGKIFIYREMRSIPTVTIEPGQTMIWDGRYRVNNDTATPIEITASGTPGLLFLEDGEYTGPQVHRASVLSSPALVADGGIICMPAFADHGKLPRGISLTRYLGLFDNILVGYDELLAQSVAEIFKLEPYTRSPVNQINKN